ncbi:MAG: glycosyltransferase family 39 protein [Verrucomicrobiota bacterium]
MYSQLPLGSALQFGGDEDYELMPSFLMSRGFKLYQDIWSDQPPVLFMLLGSAFKVWGPSILVGRLIAAGFGLLLFATFYQLVYLRVGYRAAFFVVFFLLASPGILQISVSVMQEVPAFGTALASARLLFQWRKHHHWVWLLASGAIMGIALGIKLTAIIVAPAMIIEIALAWQIDGRNPWLKPALVTTAKWAAAIGTVFGLACLIWGRGSVASSWKAHFAETSVYGLQSPGDFHMPSSVFFDHAECVGAAIVGLIFVARTRQWREFAFPVTLICTAFAIHLVHRPWWMYYYLHLAIPMSWLAGFAVSEAIAKVPEPFTKGQFNWSSQRTWQAMGLCALIAITLVRSEGRFEGGLKDLRQRERIDRSAIIAKMEVYAAHTHWVYAPSSKEAYPFSVQLPMPPELAVVTLKRFWSDQITTKEIVDTCRRYQVEQLMLNAGKHEEDWNDYLKDYNIMYSDTNFVIYISKRLTTAPATATPF